MKVSIAYATEETQLWRTLEIGETATVEDTIAQSGLLDTFHIDLKTQKVGIFGKVVKLNANLKEGDRIEIYHPITRILDEDDDEDDD